MSEAQFNAFNIASGNVEPTSLHPLFVGILIALLLLWSGWGLLHVYQGYATERITEQ
ncbi:TIGR03758 family integrating conjugative element protein, partial [Proteus mirabilis]